LNTGISTLCTEKIGVPGAKSLKTTALVIAGAIFLFAGYLDMHENIILKCL